GIRHAARQARAPRPRRRRRPPGRRPAHPDRSAQHREGGRTAGGAARRARSAERGVLPGAVQGVRRALDCRHRQLGQAGGAAQGRADRGPAQGLHLSHRLARAEGSGCARAEARRRADHRASVRSARDPPTHAGEDGAARLLPGRSSVAVDRRARQDQRRDAAVHGGRRRGRERPLRTLRRHRTANSQGGPVSFDAIDFSIVLPAFVAGLLVTATHVPLGTQVLARGIVFIDLAIAQIAGCGVLLADRVGFEPEGLAVQAAALLAALGGALLLTWTERVWPEVQEAVVGVTFVLAATGGVLLLASNVHGSEHLRDLLVGQILWVQPRWLAWTAALYAALLALWLGMRERLGRIGFYLVFALAVTISVQLVGVYLV